MWSPEAAWYSPCVRCRWDGASGRSDGGFLKWVVGWVCGRVIDGTEFEKGVWLGAYDETGHGGSLGNCCDGSELGNMLGCLVGNF